MRDLQYMIDVMTAFRDGRTVEVSGNPPLWQTCGKDIAWDWIHFDYRIAPEPRKARECWVIFPLNSTAPRIFGGATKVDAMLNAVQFGDKVVHMREVLPE